MTAKGPQGRDMAVAEIGQYKFAIGDITRRLMDDFSALVHQAKLRTAAVA